eukprot:UC1_evm1s90
MEKGKGNRLSRRGPGPSLTVPKMPKSMTTEELNAQYEEMMDQMNIPEQARVLMLKKSTQEKWQAVFMWNREKKSLEARDESKTPAAMLRELGNSRASQKDILATIKSLRICMTNLPMSWVIEFRDSNGLQSLIAIMIKCLEDPLIDDQIQLET